MIVVFIVGLFLSGEDDLAAALIEDVVFGRPKAARTLYLEAANHLDGRLKEIALFRAALCLEKSGDIKRALNEYRRLLTGVKESDIKKALVEAETRLAAILEGPAALLSSAKKDLATLKRAITKDTLVLLNALADLPESKTAIALHAYLFGCRLYEQGEYSDAIRVLKQAWILPFSTEMVERARYVLSGEGTPKPPLRTPTQQIHAFLLNRLKKVAKLPPKDRFDALYRLLWLGILSQQKWFCREVRRLITPLAKRLLREKFGSWEEVVEEAERLATKISLDFLREKEVSRKQRTGPLRVGLYLFSEGRPEGVAVEKEGVYYAGVAGVDRIERLTPVVSVETEKKDFKLLLVPKERLLHKGMRLLRVVVSGRQGSIFKVEICLFWEFEGRELEEKVRHTWKPVTGVAEIFGGWLVVNGRLFLVFWR